MVEPSCLVASLLCQLRAVAYKDFADNEPVGRGETLNWPLKYMEKASDYFAQ